MRITTKVKIALIVIWAFTVFSLFAGTIYIGSCFMEAVYGGKFGIKFLSDMNDPIKDRITNVRNYKEELTEDILEDPTQFFDEDFLDEQTKKCQAMNTAICVRVDGEYTYTGNIKLSSDLQKQIMDFQYGEQGTSREYMITMPGVYICDQLDFNIDDRDVSVILLTNYGNYMTQFRQIIFSYIFLIILIMVVLSAVLSAVTYRQFVRPLLRLKSAANEIGSGNLDVDIAYDRNRQDEIGDLCRSFEDMKNRLSDSVDMKMQYEVENRELISNISHDLKTPITTIKGYVEGIMDGVADTPEKQERYLKMIYNKANELDALINELSTYTNITNNAIPYEFHKVPVADYFADCMEEIQATLISKNMRLSYKNYCKDGTRVIVDPDQLRRVINNIITNAIKYSDKEEGNVDIRIYEEEEYIKVSISDDGTGIEKENHPHIFDRTFREDSARQSRGGSGLGLAICKKIVEEHDGRIWADSEKGKGTTIEFTLKKYIKEENTL
jgi:signal transduction histidine kinase